MKTTLADTSIWVSYLRHGIGHPWGRALRGPLDGGEVLVCGAVVAELLAGTGDRDRDRLGATLQALNWAEFGRREWVEAGELAAKLRSSGQSAALTDIEIAVAALSSSARLLTADTDFQRISKIEPRLELELIAG